MIPSARVVSLGILLARHVPLAVLRPLARGLGVVASRLARHRRAIVLSNIAQLRPELSPEARAQLATQTMSNMAEAAVHLFRIPSASQAELKSWIRVGGLEHVHIAVTGHNGVIIVTPHLGPYELGAALLGSLGMPVHAMVEEIDADTNEALARYRAATGVRLISRGAGVRPLLRLLRQGEIALLVGDRVIGEGSPGVPVAFGAGLREIPTGPAALSIATGAPVVVGTIVRTRDLSLPQRYLCTFEAPLRAHPDESAEDFARRIGERLAASVTQNPDQWYVFQPNWLPRDSASPGSSGDPRSHG